MSKRKYNDSYLQYGFTCVIEHGTEKPQCVICMKVLWNDSLRPAKLKLHLSKIHPEYATKPLAFFEHRCTSLKRQRLNQTSAFYQQTGKILEASYHVSYEIAKKKPYNIGETLVMPCTQHIVRLIIGGEHEKKIKQMSLSNDTVSRRICDMSTDIKEQLRDNIMQSTYQKIAIALDESTDIASMAQLMVYVRFVHNDDIQEDFMFCTDLETSTTASDILTVVTKFFKEQNCDGKMYVEIVRMAHLLCSAAKPDSTRKSRLYSRKPELFTAWFTATH